MSFYAPEDWAKILSVDDLQVLIERMKQKLGAGLPRVCGEVGNERKTVYNWIKNARAHVKDKTKTKVLKASLRINPVETLEYVQQKLERSSSNILLALFRRGHNKAISATTSEDFSKALLEINDLRIKYAPLVNRTLRVEIGDMLQDLRSLAVKHSVQIPPPSLEEISTAFIVGMLPTIIQSTLDSLTKVGIFDAKYISEQMHLPLEIVESVARSTETIWRNAVQLRSENDRLKKLSKDVENFIADLPIHTIIYLESLALERGWTELNSLIVKKTPTVRDLNSWMASLQKNLEVPSVTNETVPGRELNLYGGII